MLVTSVHNPTFLTASYRGVSWDTLIAYRRVERSVERQTMYDRTTTEHVDDETIETAIEDNDDPSHPDALSVDDVRELLACIQRGAEEGWDVYLDHVEDESAEVVTEDSETVVITTGQHNSVAGELEYAYEGDIDIGDGIAKTVVTQVHHTLARERCDRNWGVEYPFVIAKTDGIETPEN